jgi:tetratricopeptide (TPR) repeat protein
LGDYKESNKVLTEALRIWRREGKKNEEGMTLRMIGKSLGAQENYRSALKNCEDALPLLTEAKNQKEVGETSYDAGVYREALGEYGEADQSFNKAKQAFAAAEDEEGQARCLRKLGDVYMAQRQYDKAKGSYTQAVEAYKPLKKYASDLAYCYRALGDAEFNTASLDAAASAFKNAYAIYSNLDDKENVALSANKQGLVEAGFGKFEAAEAKHNEALNIYQGLRDDRGRADALYNLAQVKEATQQVKEAINKYEEALALYKTAGAQLEVANTLNKLGLLYTSTGDAEKGRSYLDQSQQLLRSIRAGR